MFFLFRKRIPNLISFLGLRLFRLAGEEKVGGGRGKVRSVDGLL